eukprot:15331291-Heterocapsa_arctica.AAC.1
MSGPEGEIKFGPFASKAARSSEVAVNKPVDDARKVDDKEDETADGAASDSNVVAKQEVARWRKQNVWADEQEVAALVGEDNEPTPAAAAGGGDRTFK